MVLSSNELGVQVNRVRDSGVLLYTKDTGKEAGQDRKTKKKRERKLL